MFVHAGVLPVLSDHINKGGKNSDKLKYINMVVRKWLLNNLSNLNIMDKSTILDDDKLSPFWTRIYGSIPIGTDINSDQCSEFVKKALDIYKIGRMIVGHTPQFSKHNIGINGTCYNNGDKKLYRVDGGFSKAFNMFGNPKKIEVLEIINDNEFNIISSD